MHFTDVILIGWIFDTCSSNKREIMNWYSQPLTWRVTMTECHRWLKREVSDSDNDEVCHRWKEGRRWVQTQRVRKKVSFRLNTVTMIDRQVTVYADSDWAGDKDSRRSVGSYIVFLNEVPISWTLGIAKVYLGINGIRWSWAISNVSTGRNNVVFDNLL